ncbi:Dabb family protein [Microbacterium album]|uniref:Stress-response A/B barrel domain-containing protein n=1 Tax=Microbacterium album TaxID=2053191 RepID=A0A917MMN8_9MICO|nr:Dabb family protein [Microbacterium album]GGH48370.1 hypothetical protein GCM10010921_25770 [Microbacterium album]
MAIRHLVLRQYKDGVTPQQISELESRTRGLAEIPGILNVITGPNLGLVPRSDGFDNVTLIDLESPDTLRDFIAHPIHKETAALSSQLVERSIILDIALD